MNFRRSSSKVSSSSSAPTPPINTAPLVRACEHLLQPNGSIIGAHVAAAVLPLFANLRSAFPVSDRPALACMDETVMKSPCEDSNRKSSSSNSARQIKASASGSQAKAPMSHSDIDAFLEQSATILHKQHGIGRGHRVAVVLPNGPELALAILVVTHVACCVPMNAFGATEETEKDWQSAAVDIVWGLYDDAAVAALAARANLPFMALTPHGTKAGMFALDPPTRALPAIPKRLATSSDLYSDLQRFMPNTHDDEVLVLFTSGTTGSKKLVPHLLADLLVATACIAVSWRLTPHDMNCNLMPLFHVGGIIRQVFSPILSGGGVICCPSFDPSLFWQLLSEKRFTWYYAAPTMHALILETGRAEGYIAGESHSNARRSSSTEAGAATTAHLRMIANAAGGLLPSLARELRQVFINANVLPSYGMTECMPISSPPANYQLEKPGTSGVAVGPELAILDLLPGNRVQELPRGKEGPICVRGQPCFRGYGAVYGEHDDALGSASAMSFYGDGWFNTGDLGYMDEDGYLYITGRSKEVINRGGEIISPLEVEDAINGHPDVQQAVAFSTQHAVLQEVVGLVLIPKPGRPRLDLPGLHEYLGAGRLAAPKWPQCLVYMEGVPKSHTNKLLRVKLGQRLSLPVLDDNMYWIERTFQAKCPKIGTPVSVAIPCERVKVNAATVQTALRVALAGTIAESSGGDVIVLPHPSRLGSLVAYVYNLQRLEVVKVAKEKLDAYLVPSHVCQASSALPSVNNGTELSATDSYLPPPEPSDAIAAIEMEAMAAGQGPADPLVMALQEIFQEMLYLDCLPSPDTNFFNLGGSSMLASQLASRVRKLYDVPFGGAEVFHHSSCNAIANIIRERKGETSSQAGNKSESSATAAASAASSLFSKNLNLKGIKFDANRIDFQAGFGAYVFQLVPIFVIYPVWQLTRFFLFFRLLLEMLGRVPGGHNLFVFVFTLVLYHFLWVTLTPLAFVAIKWTVIGRYRAGRYPFWSAYFLRWWFVDVMRKMIGRGSWGSQEWSLNLYYRLLGANIGEGAHISSEAEIAEYDLVDIGAGASVEYATMRGFGVDNGAMLLGPVGCGKFSSVGARSVVAPNTFIPDGKHLGPVTASYEINSLVQDDSDQQKHIRYNRRSLPQPSMLSQMLVCSPITFLIDSISHLPALSVLYWMVTMPWHKNDPFHTASDLMEWLCDVRRIPFYIGIRVARALAAPLLYMLGAVIVKRTIIGTFQPGPRDVYSEWQLIRHYLAATIFSRENMQEATELLGRHYELVSVLYRALGAKIGKRVFWPGHQPVFSGEFDLLEIGDDVVFGSRTVLVCTTADSLEKIVLCAGANVSDNTVVLPGSIIGKNAVLGSNSVCPAGRYLPESSVWFGARGGEPVMLEKGIDGTAGSLPSQEVPASKMPMFGDDSTLRPFGRAFYNRDAPYFVLPLWFMILFTAVSRVVNCAVHTVPILGALHLTAGFFYGFRYDQRDYDAENIPFSSVYVIMLMWFMVTHLMRVVLWLFIEVSSKWVFMGQRQVGRYNWDQSSYGQNWELYQIVTKIRTFGRLNFLDFLAGSPYLVTFFRMHGCEVGRDCCLYPAGGDPYMPEPDLVVIGDRCVVDCASVVCHLNTRGNFELAKITMENNVTLRTRSRIQQGVYMEQGSMLLEKSLAMTGEVIEAESVWQGAPASRLFSYETSSIGTRPSADLADNAHADDNKPQRVASVDKTPDDVVGSAAEDLMSALV